MNGVAGVQSRRAAPVLAGVQGEGDLMTLQEFIDTHHAKLVSMTREKVAKRSKHRRPEDLETRHGAHLVLDQLRGALEDEARRDPSQGADAELPTNPNIARSAALHGHDLLALGFSVEEVVHDYGDICQAVTELAVELDEDLSVAEFHTLNRCLDNAIAAAVHAWTEAPQAPTTEGQEVSSNERLRRLLGGAIAAFELLRSGRIGVGGSTGAILGNNLTAMHALLATSPSRETN